MLSAEHVSSIALASAAAVVFSVYFLTASPSIAGGDSGELVAEGCSLGTAHPPGYPLFTMMIYALKEFIPFLPETASVAYRANISSGLFTAGAAYLIGEMVALFPGRPHDISGSLFGMLMFAFSPLIWQYAVTAEVFPMNTFFAALLSYCTLLFARKRDFSIALIGAFVSGLALCNQHTIVLFEAPLMLWMAWMLRRYIIANPMSLVQLGVAFIAGLLPYLYIPIAANMNPTHGSWGHVKTFEGFVHHFLRHGPNTISSPQTPLATVIFVPVP